MRDQSINSNVNDIKDQTNTELYENIQPDPSIFRQRGGAVPNDNDNYVNPKSPITPSPTAKKFKISNFTLDETSMPPNEFSIVNANEARTTHKNDSDDDEDNVLDFYLDEDIDIPAGDDYVYDDENDDCIATPFVDAEQLDEEQDPSIFEQIAEYNATINKTNTEPKSIENVSNQDEQDPSINDMLDEYRKNSKDQQSYETNTETSENKRNENVASITNNKNVLIKKTSNGVEYEYERTPEKKERKPARDKRNARNYQRLHRARQTDAEKEHDLTSQRKRMTKLRANPEKRISERIANRTRMSDLRENPEKRIPERAADKKRKSNTREIPEKRIPEREADKKRKSDVRADPEKRIPERKANTTRMKTVRKRGVRYNAATKRDDIALYRLSDFTILCKHCNAIHCREQLAQNQIDSFNDCCAHGKVELRPLPEYPKQFRELFENNPRFNGASFFDRIRTLNSLISFAAISNPLRNKDDKRPDHHKGGIYSYVTHGTVYTNFNHAAKPDDGKPPTNGQLYFVDTDQL